MNKKGNIMTMLWFFIILFGILFLGFIMVVGSAIVNWVWDEAMPELTNLGTIDRANMTDIASYTLTPANTFIQSLTWLTGVMYVLMLIGSLGFVYFTRSSPSKWLVGFFFMLAVVLILGSIFISNIYEDFYTGTDDLATRLKEHTVLSFMILYSPMIFTIIVFSAGILLFSGISQDEGGNV